MASTRQDPPPTGQPIISEPGFLGEMNLSKKDNTNNTNNNNSNKNKP